MHNTVPTMAIEIVVSAVGMDTTIAEAIMCANAGLRIVVGSKKGVAANGNANIGAAATTSAMDGTVAGTGGIAAMTIKP